ncbi:ScbR family autoregulator-binding transcription factor [Streptomyces sp. AK02-01A]|uniref:ScbR family autoregulator-binding transcription factor n=1 Tax=Streptomyces sp. AK02-01A TaxID=3028648 RepID=UPI0029ACD07D|nr:ScbR family autoregulator-binding transcription factor [Streptomyces sp. AK02-01A]MDX3850029.1 ScbR family autoregulator-binding transcription factor [Streptomyces sp. AK02-01A]
MAQQQRAIRTRAAILEAAASVFDQYGYDAATIAEILARSAVTKGALYFHFPSKEDLARGVLRAQTRDLVVGPADWKVQELIDVTMVVAHRSLHDMILRAGTRLAVEQGSVDFSDDGPFPVWSRLSEDLLVQAKERGELLPYVNPRETAELLVGAWTGIHVYSRVMAGRQDVERRVSVMWEHLLPSMVMPRLLLGLDVAHDRGARVEAARILAAAETTETADAADRADGREPADG